MMPAPRRMSPDSDRVALHRALGVRLPAQGRRHVLGERLQHVKVVLRAELIRYR